MIDDVIVVIPSKRPPPIRTLVSFPTERKVLVISDPRVKDQHEEWIKRTGLKSVIVVRGKIGMSQQVAECYRQAFKAGYSYYFRLDDDQHDKLFVTDDGYADLEEAIAAARRCAFKMKTSLNGFINSARRDWLGTGYKRSYGLIHGGAHLSCSAEDPSEFIDCEVSYYEDVYRSLRHIEIDGAVGRVNFIGLDKRISLRDSSASRDEDVQEKDKKIILGRFPGRVSCNGYRILDSGRQKIPDWRLLRPKGWNK